MSTRIVVECTEGWFSSEGQLLCGGQDPGSSTASGLPPHPFSWKALSTTTQMQRGRNNNNGINSHNDDISGKPMMSQRQLTNTRTKYKPSHIPTHLLATCTYRRCSSGMIAVMTTATAVINVGGIAVVNGTQYRAC